MQPGGVFAHIGVHPCFCGGFADRADLEAVVIRPGYLDSHWTMPTWARPQGVRDKVGASHWPMASLLNSFVAAGFALERFSEFGGPAPIGFCIRAGR